MGNQDNNQDNNGHTGSLVKRLYQAVWQLESAEQSPGVLFEVREGIERLGIDFQGCSIFLIEQRETVLSVRYHDLSVYGRWREMREEDGKEELVRIWEEGETVSGWKMEQEAELQDGEHPTRPCRRDMRGVLEVPFSHGVLGVYSDKPGAFDDEDAENLEQVALILSALYHRLGDLERLNTKERQLRQVQRLQLVGQLTAEVAHEINNPLTVVIGECDLLLDGTLEPDLQESICAISKAGLQAQAVGNRLLDFVRGHKSEKEWINFNRLVLETLELMRRMLKKENVVLEQELARNLPWIEAHAGQVQQVVLNLIQNSRDALNGYRVQGVIKVRTYGRDNRVVLEVEDNGPGIPEDIQKRIFEPFFSTKTNGQGTGLGLSICAGIAKEHGGELRLEKRLMGTCMVLEFPVRQYPMMSSN